MQCTAILQKVYIAVIAEFYIIAADNRCLDVFKVYIVSLYRFCAQQEFVPEKASNKGAERAAFHSNFTASDFTDPAFPM